jgi:hypothetical protein
VRNVFKLFDLYSIDFSIDRRVFQTNRSSNSWILSIGFESMANMGAYFLDLFEKLLVLYF